MIKKGGDIDLYFEAANIENIYESKIRFLVELDKRIGEQKVDVVISSDKNAPIKQSAMKYGIALWANPNRGVAIFAACLGLNAQNKLSQK